jgi:hypothetical protein
MSEMSDEKPAWDPDGILPNELHYFFERQIEDEYVQPRTDFKIVAYTEILWCGWECDFGIVLLDIDGGRETIMLAAVDRPGDKGPAEMLRERIEAYREAIESTERFLAALDGGQG